MKRYSVGIKIGGKDKRLYNESSKEGSGLIVTGYVLCFLSLVVIPIPLSIAGFVVGIVNLTKGKVGHGIAQIILSIVCGMIGGAMGAYFGAKYG